MPNDTPHSATAQTRPSQTEGLPEGLLVAWYGDDFTGAAATMEVLTFAGLPAVLFLDVPTPEQLSRFPGLRAVGIASTARAQSPQWMSDTLPHAFESLAALDPRILHYKVCSTLDSSPTTGSIGRAMEIGADLCGSSVVPVLIAAPQMQRYQFHGHLFAGVGDAVVRLDRHPVMSRHPVTPMTEADVARHIALQSDRIDAGLLSLDDHAAGRGLPEAAQPGRIAGISLDSIDAASETAAGRALWEARKTSRFVIGSQGIEFALVAHWQDQGWLEKAEAPRGLGRSGPMVSVSGSVSPTTADQIAWSRDNGFACIEFDAAAVCGDAQDLSREIERAQEAALKALSAGQDPLIHTAAGPDDPAVAHFRAAVARSGVDSAVANQRLGEALGTLLHGLLETTDVGRAVVSGGDTSGFATQKLGIYALSALAPTIPGASIFRAHADGPRDGFELALKGGQMGSPDYFGWVRDGGGQR